MHHKTKSKIPSYKLQASGYKLITPLLWLVCIIFAAYLFRIPIIQNAVAFGEDVMLVVAPTAERYYEYGDRHFDASHVTLYDINRAEYMYTQALRLDARLPFVHHQLARIAFLHGDFPMAMWYIDKEIALPGGPKSPSSFYIRGLIEGFAGMYTDSAIDYEKYLRFYPQNWAGVNDYAWVLMKANRPREAEAVTARELPFYPTNPWLLNSNATALYEMGRTKDAYAQILKARDALSTITREKWLIAYPGNDPAVAEQGIASFKKSVEDNIHSMGASTTVPIVK